MAARNPWSEADSRIRQNFSHAGCGRYFETASVSLRSTGGSAHPEEQRHQATQVSLQDVPELRLLENGREDRTPVRAVRRGVRPRSSLRWNCLSILPSRSLSVATQSKTSVGFARCSDSHNRRRVSGSPGAPIHEISQIARVSRNIPIRSERCLTSRSVTAATAAVIDRLLLESLILAQDERWRHA